jgi:hypothetical protein
MIPNDDFNALKAIWPTHPVYGLTDLLQKHERPSTFQRVDLARTCHDAPQAHERMKAALGKVGGNKDAYVMMWGDIGSDDELLAAALDCGLHLHYHTPDESSKLFRSWMGSGGEHSHRCAALAWDRAISGFYRPHMIEHLLDPDDFSLVHMEHWKDRVGKTWSQMSLEQRMPIMIKFLARCVADRQSSNPWTTQWTDILLDQASCTPKMVAECMRLCTNDERHPCLLRLATYLQAHQLEIDTPAVSSRTPARRM